MTKYKLIAADLDETLLNSQRKVSPKTLEAIDRARKSGVHFVLATGRPYFSTLGTQQEVGVYRQPGEYTLTLNGAAVIDNESEEALFCEGLPFEVINDLFQEALKYDVGIHVYTDNQVWGWKITEDEWNYVNGRMKVDELPSPSIDFLKDSPLVKILFVNTDENVLHQIARDLEHKTKDLEVSYSSNRYIEFNKKGIHKGYGLLKLGEKLGIQPEEMIAVGDNFNDLGMIQAAGLGIGVANSNPGIIPYCDVITQNDCDNDPIAEIIDTYIFGE